MTSSASATPPPQPAASPDNPPRLGRFRLLSKLGKGGMGVVFRARDEKLGRHVALKVISKDASGKPTLRTEAFLREARAIAQLDHPHIVQIFEIGEEGRFCFIAMELLEGGDLWRLFRTAGKIDPARVALLGAEAAEALAFAHSNGVIHRDVKPANLMFSRNGRCKLTDFGLARSDDPNDSFSLPTQAVGTPFYLSPEVIQGKAAGAASDVYSLGITLWLVMTGTPPFSGKSRAELYAAKLNHPLPDLRLSRRDIPEAMLVALERALDRDPARRIPMEVLAAALRLHVTPASTAPAGNWAQQPTPTGAGASALLEEVSQPTPGAASAATSPGGKSILASQASAVSMISPTAASLIENQHDPRKRMLFYGLVCVAVIVVVLIVGGLAWLIFGPNTVQSLPPVAREKIATSELRLTDSQAFTARLGWGDRSPVRAVGIVAAVEPMEKSILIRFVDSRVLAELPRTCEADLQRRFGGPQGAHLAGKTVTITSAVSGTASQPTLALSSAEQIKLSDPIPAPAAATTRPARTPLF